MNQTPPKSLPTQDPETTLDTCPQSLARTPSTAPGPSTRRAHQELALSSARRSTIPKALSFSFVSNPTLTSTNERIKVKGPLGFTTVKPAAPCSLQPTHHSRSNSEFECSRRQSRKGISEGTGTARSATTREHLDQEPPSASNQAQRRAQPDAQHNQQPGQHKAMQPGGTASSTATGGRRRVSVQSTRSAGATPASSSSSSVWEARMKMDEVRGGVKVFSAGAADEPADEEGVRVYRRLRRNQSEGGGAGAADTAAKKRRSWKASKPVTAIGDLRKSRSDAAAAAVTTATTTATAVVARRAVARVSMPEKKVAPAPAAAAGEVKEVVVVEVHKAAAADTKNMARGPDEELDDDDDGAEGELLDEEQETDEEEEKEMLDLQDHMAIDDDEQTAPHQGKDP